MPGVHPSKGGRAGGRPSFLPSARSRSPSSQRGKIHDYYYYCCYCYEYHAELATTIIQVKAHPKLRATAAVAPTLGSPSAAARREREGENAMMSFLRLTHRDLLAQRGTRHYYSYSLSGATSRTDFRILQNKSVAADRQADRRMEGNECESACLQTRPLVILFLLLLPQWVTFFSMLYIRERLIIPPRTYTLQIRCTGTLLPLSYYYCCCDIETKSV